MHRFITALSLTFAVLQMTPAGAQVSSQSKKLLPSDDAAKDPSFFSFRAQLLQALQRRDTAHLYSVLAPEIKNSFGGDDSIAGFKRIWKMNQPNSPVWDALTRALSLGGRLQDSTFTAPYVYAHWPNDVDGFEFVAIVGENVSVRREPKRDAERITGLSWDIVTLKDWQDLPEHGVPNADSWAQVELGDGRTGWVAGRYVHSPITWRGIFEKRNGRWLLTIFVAGD